VSYPNVNIRYLRFCRVREGAEKSNFYIFDFLGEEDDEDEEEMVNYLNIKGKTA
jgi:hypothetical protein